LRILLVNTSDIGGGAEGSSRRLFNALRERGHESWLAVGRKRSVHENILQIPNDQHRSRWANFIYKQLIFSRGKQLPSQVITLVRIAVEPRRWIERQLGIEDFNYPGTRHILNLPSARPDVVHLFNLHGDYFDLRQLPRLSRQAPLILNPRDAWLLSGHCAHSSECNRWKIGCGHCPDLERYPAIRRDASAHNWKRKQRIFSQSHLYVATPSQWLMNEIETSLLAGAVAKSCVIPTGIDLSLFFPSDQNESRARLGIPQDARILLFSANKAQATNWKDFKTARTAVERVIEKLSDEKILFLALGGDGEPVKIGASEIRFIPFQQDRKVIADYYRAADIYIHAARADTFPNTVMESLACGTPVIATNVGGIPEQVKGFGNSALNPYGIINATGILVNMGDAEAMASAMNHLLSDEPVRFRLGQNAAMDARRRFDFNQQVDRFITWYQEVIADWTITVGQR
jgi:glycosyltransferase involved in cell wall biosynthesis